MTTIKEHHEEWNDNNSSYIGDGVYIRFDGFGFWLHANDHKNPTDRIYLEPETLEAIYRFTERMYLLHKEDK